MKMRPTSLMMRIPSGPVSGNSRLNWKCLIVHLRVVPRKKACPPWSSTPSPCPSARDRPSPLPGHRTRVVNQYNAFPALLPSMNGILRCEPGGILLKRDRRGIGCFESFEEVLGRFVPMFFQIGKKGGTAGTAFCGIIRASKTLLLDVKCCIFEVFRSKPLNPPHTFIV